MTALVRYGTTFAGEVDQINQESVVTKFFYVASFFVFPMGSFYSLGGTADGFKGFRIKLNFKSLTVALIFSWLLTASVITILIAVFSKEYELLTFSCLGIALAFGSRSLGHLSEREKRRRQVLIDVVGMGVKPGFLYKDMARPIFTQLEEKWVQATSGTSLRDWRILTSLDALPLSLLKVLFCLALYADNKQIAEQAWRFIEVTSGIMPRLVPKLKSKEFLLISSLTIALGVAVSLVIGPQLNHRNVSGILSRYSISSLHLEMLEVPGSSKFPIGFDESDSCISVNYPYYMAKTEVTYAQWKRIYDWALKHGYIFGNKGCRGGYWKDDDKVYVSEHADHPVTNVNWYDCLVWCNALTEYSNAMEGTDYVCVYRYNDTIVRNAKDKKTDDNVEADSGNKGYRLPTSMEWELAARYIDGNHWISAYNASGAPNNTDDRRATDTVSWNNNNSNFSTHPVATKKSNTLGIYDMSGNVREWCFDWNPDKLGSERVNRGGDWNSNTIFLMTGDKDSDSPSLTLSDGNQGFRPVRTE